MSLASTLAATYGIALDDWLQTADNVHPFPLRQSYGVFVALFWSTVCSLVVAVVWLSPFCSRRTCQFAATVTCHPALYHRTEGEPNTRKSGRHTPPLRLHTVANAPVTAGHHTIVPHGCFVCFPSVSNLYIQLIGRLPMPARSSSSPRTLNRQDTRCWRLARSVDLNAYLGLILRCQRMSA